MKIFDDDGHLSEHGFFVLSNDVADDLQRLEISEHLSFCDACLNLYLEKLSQEALITPEPTLVPMIQTKAKNIRSAMFYRNFTVVAAGFLAMMLWTSGAFTWQYRLLANDPAAKLAEKTYEFTKQANDARFMLDEKLFNTIGQIRNFEFEEIKYNIKEKDNNGEK